MLGENELHAQPTRRGIRETCPGIERPAGLVRDEADIGSRGGLDSHLLQEVVQHHATQSLSLVSGQRGHVSDVEAPAPVAQKSPHRDGLVAGGMRHVHEVAPARQSPSA